ncbi:two-component sensor histidine kinase [Lactobacillus kefiranofaciens]|uniref:sensor histidine kinase n=1 Tax=Lactobacillus kefiranofaciens TaxID=267818 RepID=UPI000BA62291|nr:HAMP domain-containing sensor histidine kinase [Lactobacillus kefiranofaciens]MCP9331145.1 HAMP domain-containing histidine kinase [Lactobacillus kefiranofaciens]PAK98541.1 two-component sensor histidine kinase [Lactobacillus kefiranofaciens]
MKVKTTTEQLTQLFVSLFTIILVLVNIAFLVISSAYIYHHAQERSQDIAEAVEENLNPEYDWTALLDAYLAKQEDDAITLTTPQGRTYYSEDAHETFKKIGYHRHYQSMVFTEKHIYFLNSATHHGFRINVALNIDELFALISWLFFTMLGINALAILISIPLIRRFAHKWSRPIQHMNAEIKDIRNGNRARTKITVPQQPMEIKNLARSFNNLLAFQHNALQREHQFVSDASHELKTPIAAIRGHVNLIKRHGQSHPEIVASSLNYIDKESQKMQALVNELLTLGRIDYSNSKITKIDLVKIISDVITEVSSVYPQKICTHLPEKLDFPIQTTDFRNIVHNLMGNAAKYSPANSEINISLLQKDMQVIFKVADHGMGIAPENRKKIFYRFYREDNSHSSKIAGSGLGLAIVKSEINKYHGKITIENNSPQGTIFTVYLPIEK